MSSLSILDQKEVNEKARLLSTIRGVFSYTRIFSTAPVKSISDFRYNWDTILHCTRVQDKASLFFSTLMFTNFKDNKIACRDQVRNFLEHFSYHTISEGFFLHDLGKPYMLNSSIFDKENSLSEKEIQAVKEHPITGEAILRAIHDKERRVFNNPKLQELSEIAYRILRNIILHHHERYDGTGYPQELKGEQIPFEARVATIVDVHDALSNARFYKAPWKQEDVMAYFKKERGKLFDPNLVDFILTQGISIGNHSIFESFNRVDEMHTKRFYLK